MADIQGGKAISLVQRGGIVEAPNARTFVAQASDGDHEYEVTLGLPRTEERPDGSSCTCQAGQHRRLCYHVRAAHLLARREARS